MRKRLLCLVLFGFVFSLFPSMSFAAETLENMFSWEGNQILRYIGIGSVVVIPSRATSISEYVFKKLYRNDLGTIPNSVTSIGKTAFNRCTSLKSITRLKCLRLQLKIH